MRIVATCVVPYQRTLPRPIVTSHGTYRERMGFLLLVRDDLGNVGVGDASPLPGLSPESLQECESAISNSLALIENLDVSRSFFLSQLLPQSPAALFAAATALGDLIATRAGLPLARALQSDSVSQIPVNGMITKTGRDDIAMQVAALEASGFKHLKLKVGIKSAADDIARICAVVDASPDVVLRPDANAGWDKQWAEEVLSEIPIERLEFIEQPFPRGHAAESSEFAKKFGVRLALDEDVQTIDEAEELIRNRVCDVLVLKPMVLGRLYQCALLAQKAREGGIEVIYTSSWETDIGLAATLHLAAALGPGAPAMGLSTAGMISEGIVKNPLKIEDGYLNVPEGPGLGIELAPEILAQLQCI